MRFSLPKRKAMNATMLCFLFPRCTSHASKVLLKTTLFKYDMAFFALVIQLCVLINSKLFISGTLSGDFFDFIFQHLCVSAEVDSREE